MVGKYPVITLCGSTRFKDAFIEAQKRLTLEGNIVISVGLFGHSGDDEVWTEGTKEMLDNMHKRKIDMADSIYVINVGGYIGESTRSEIEYARRNGKAVRFLEEPWRHKTMFKVSNPISTPPPEYASPLQRMVYEAFAALDIPFERVDTDPGLTMEDCQHIDAKIGVRIVKTVFLCNRQQAEFWLYVTKDDKPFVTRDFCGALGIPRVSFAPADKLEALTGVKVGATTILSARPPAVQGVHLVMDQAVAEDEWFACTDGTATCFVKIRTEDLLGKYIPSTSHSLTIIP